MIGNHKNILKILILTILTTSYLLLLFLLNCSELQCTAVQNFGELQTAVQFVCTGP